MRLKNNSNLDWLGYYCGDSIIDIPANAEFEVTEKEAQIILKNLGAPNWITKVTNGSSNLADNVGLLASEPFCKYCDSKGVKHKKNCTRSLN